MEIIETNRLILRKPKLSDAYSLLPLLSDMDVQEYTPGLYCDTLPDVLSYLRLVKKYDYSMDMCFVIEHKDSKKIIGIIEGYADPDNIFPVSYICLRSERGNGYIPEATKEFIRFIKANYFFDKILFSIKKNNLSSRKVMQKLNINYQWQSNNSFSYYVSLAEELPF